jgi:hypothetical protein
MVRKAVWVEQGEKGGMEQGSKKEAVEDTGECDSEKRRGERRRGET